ncbi:MAG: hypothetical protein IKZ06_00960 [Oscillospiraceae bacterium]|nr:hypothetical protein [Oscillospiraceae bacterium]
MSREIIDLINQNQEAKKTEKEPTFEEKAETAIEELRNRYSEKVRANYEEAAQKLRKERDDALRENWILQQRAKAALPEKISSAGLNGGALESNLTGLLADYQNGRNEIRKDYSEKLSENYSELNSEKMKNEESFDKQWIEYLLSLAKAEEKKNF